MKRTSQYLLSLVAIIMGISMSTIQYATAHANENLKNIRVGLDSKFKNVSEVKIMNKSVQLYLNGYTANISSSDVIKINISNKYYNKSNSRFNSYSEAKHESDYINYNNSSAKAKVAMTSDGFYVYSGGYGSQGEATKNALNDTTPISTNSNLLELSSGQNSIIIENHSDFKISDLSGEYIQIGGVSYRGSLGIAINSGKLTAVSVVPVEEYLYSVVPSEMPSSWNLEALKAQTVSARSYMMTQAGVHSKLGYDVCDTVHCQVYSGVKTETERTTKAVNDTAGIMAYYDDKPINAVFFSSSGGITDNSENTWVSEIPYLKSVVEINEKDAKVWTRRFTSSELNSIVSQKASTIGQLKSIRVGKIVNERVSELIIEGSKGQKVLKGEEVRTFFNVSKDGSLFSRYFRIGQAPPVISKSPIVPPAQENIAVNSIPNENATVQNNTNQSSENPVIPLNKSEEQLVQDGSIYIYGSDGVKSVKINDLFFVDSSDQTKKVETDYNIYNSSSSNAILENNNSKNIVANNNIQIKALNQNSDIKNNLSVASNDSYSNGIYNGSGDLVLYGRGWGHGVGLSQYGAKGMAEEGYTYDQILKYYFTGISLK